MALGAIHLHQATTSRYLSRIGVACRFRPSCSRYAAAMLERHGAAGSTWPVLQRLARCGPWTPAGTDDPPR